ncbi:MAG: hypothetical protein H8E24_11695 [Verrucomicrobia bacterium]|nr:hypothetical protein [Verrucomicrobiota bacterium]
MSKKTMWILAGAAFALNLVGLLWIRNEIVGPAARIEAEEESVLRVAVFQPGEDEPAEDADKLLIVFNRELVPAAEVGKPMGWQPFLVEPLSEGQWLWSRTNAMEFRLKNPLPVGNRFSAKASAHFASQLGEPLEGKKEFFFNSSPLRVEHCLNLGRMDGRIRIEFRFNQEVEPDVLSANLQATTRDPAVKLKGEVLSTGMNRRHMVAFEEPKDRFLVVKLKKGMAGVSGPLGLKNEFVNEIELRPTFAALSARTPWRWRTEEKTSVELRFNEMLDPLQTMPRISVTPKVEGVTSTLSRYGIRLHGAFDSPMRLYLARIEGDVRSFDGQVLPAGTKFRFKMPSRSPSIGFVRSRGVLSPKGNLSLELKTVAVSDVRLSATKVYPNNLAAHLRGESLSRVGRELFSEVVSIEGRAASSVKTTLLRLSDWIEKPLGLYSIQAEAENRRWTSDVAVVAVTDLAITTKAHPSGILTWITSLSEGKPVAGVEVTVLSTKNQRLAGGKTDERGLVELDAPADHPAGEPWIVLAAKGDDLSFRRLDQRKWDLPTVNKDGREPPKGLNGFLYAARGIRRPGDVVRLTGIVRDDAGEAPAPNIPFELRIYRPDGKLAKTMPVGMSKGGTFHTSFDTPEEAWTGTWRFALSLPGSETNIAETTTGVEAFVPVRLEVKSEPTQSWFGHDQPPEVSISARYLFGVAGADLPFQVAGDWSKVSFEAVGLEDFHFGDKDSHEKMSLRTIDGMTDETGSASVFPPSDRLSPGLWEAAGFVTVNSTGGASVSDRFTLRKLAASRLVGLRIANGGKPLASEPFSIEFVAAGPLADEVPVGNVEVVLEKLETDWVMQRVDERWTWHRREDAFEVTRKLVENVAGAEEDFARIEMTCPEPGTWRLVVRDLVGGAVTKMRLNVPRVGQPIAATGSPHRVGLSLDRDSYRPGEMARVAVEVPFAGELLLSVETDHVAWAETFTLSESRAVLEVPLPSRMPGGAFVTASVVRSLDFKSPDWKPHRAYGMVRVATDFSKERLDVELDVLDKVQPGTEVTVRAKVKADESAYVHLWAVDEGVLSVTDYKTPDPTDLFFDPWRAKIDSGDLYLELLPDHKRPSSMERFGAGGGSSRRSLVKARSPKTVILWNEFVPLGKDGFVESKFAIPSDFTGEVRFMAVAVAGNSYGSAESSMTVTSPLLVETSLPRFVAPGDKFLSPVTLFNSTDEDIVAKTEFILSGPVQLLGDSKQTVALAAGGSSTIWFEMEAKRRMGVALVSVRASGHGLLAETSGTFPVRPAATLDAAYETFVMNAGESRTIELPERFLADGAKRTVTLSASPVTDLRPALDDLLGFPYGCVEQTTSKVMPLAYADKLLGGGKAEFAKEAVLAGIERLSTMQTRSGGLAYWPGGREPNLWGTCYASSFLIEAKAAGHSIDKEFIDGVVGYLRESLRSGENDLPEQAFICQVLATFGQPETSRQRYLLDQVGVLDLAGRARLAGAWLANGRPDLARKSLPDDTLSLTVSRTFKGRLTSQTAAESVLLSVLLDLDDQHPWISELKHRILRGRKNGRWRSTLDNGLAIAALCKLQASAESNAGSFSGELIGPNGTVVSFSSEDTTETSFVGSGEIRLSPVGEGKLYVSVLTEGLVAPESIKPVNDGLKVLRRWTTADGKVLRDWKEEGGDPVKVEIGDLVWVEVKLQTLDVEADNVAVVDALPGGFAVENPRLATSAMRSPSEPTLFTSQPDSSQFLDDRVILFASAKHRPQVFRYAIRAVAGGEFLLPPVQDSCMYDESQRSLGGMGSVKVAVR